MIVVNLIVGCLIFFIGIMAVLSKRLIFERIESCAFRLFIIDFICELDDGKFLLLAHVKLVNEFIVYFHEFFLEDSDLLFVLAAFTPGGG